MVSGKATGGKLGKDKGRHGSERAIAAVLLGGLSMAMPAVLAGCGGDSLAEFGLEQAIEAQGGGDVDIDFASGDGDFSIRSEDGEIVFDLDGENTTLSFANDEESGVVSFDSDSGITTMVTEDGVVTSSQHVPDDWPDHIGVPQTLKSEESFFTVGDIDGNPAFNAYMAHDIGERYHEHAAERLAAAGFEYIEISGMSLDDEHGNGRWERGDEVIVLTWSPGLTTVSGGVS